jgi:hypothetical protein
MVADLGVGVLKHVYWMRSEGPGLFRFKPLNNQQWDEWIFWNETATIAR